MLTIISRCLLVAVFAFLPREYSLAGPLVSMGDWEPVSVETLGATIGYLFKNQSNEAFVTHLGALDVERSDFLKPVEVGLWKAGTIEASSDGVADDVQRGGVGVAPRYEFQDIESVRLLGQVSIELGATSSSLNGFRYGRLSHPITLEQNTLYVVGMLHEGDTSDLTYVKAGTDFTFADGLSFFDSRWGFAEGPELAFPKHALAQEGAYIGPNLLLAPEPAGCIILALAAGFFAKKVD